MKPLYLTIADIHQRTGIEPVAKAVGVSQRAIYQWGESPDESGKISPIQRFKDWAELVTSTNDPEVHAAVLEFLQPILVNMNVCIMRQDTVDELRRILTYIAPGDRRMDETTTVCATCQSVLVLIQRPDGVTGWCNGCRKAA